MAFTKRRKQPHFSRGENPHPTAEEVRAEAGTHVGRVHHSWPHPTEEQARVLAPDASGKVAGAPSSRKRKPRLAPSRKARTKH